MNRRRRIIAAPTTDIGDGIHRQDVRVEGEPYRGESCCLLPLVVHAGSEQEASALMDAATATVVKALEAHPRVKLATNLSDAQTVIDACDMTRELFAATLRAVRAQQARDN